MLQRLVARDRVAVDVGAADGVYTHCLTRLASECVAFEPNPDSAAAVRHRVPRANVYEIALSDRSGRTTLRVPMRSGARMAGLATIEAANSLHGMEFANLNVAVSTLDAFKLPRVGFIKIDVEGHELAVLRGAERTLMRDRPVVLVEVEERHRPGARESVIAWLKARGYAKQAIPSVQNMLFIFAATKQGECPGGAGQKTGAGRC